MQEYRRKGLTTLTSTNDYEIEKRRRESELLLRKSKETTPYLYSERPSALARGPRARVELAGADAGSSVPGRLVALPIQKPMRKPGAPLDLTGADGVELLSKTEAELCSTLRVLPKVYLMIKNTILDEYNKRGSLKRGEARQLVRIDVNKTGKIYDFFVQVGWVKPPS